MELTVNDVVIGQWPVFGHVAGADIMVRGGWGGQLELCETEAPVQRYIGNPNEPMPTGRPMTIMPDGSSNSLMPSS